MIAFKNLKIIEKIKVPKPKHLFNNYASYICVGIL